MKKRILISVLLVVGWYLFTLGNYQEALRQSHGQMDITAIVSFGGCEVVIIAVIYAGYWMLWRD